MKPRQNIYLDEELNKHLDTLAAKPGSSKSAIIRDALTAYLARRGAKELQDTFSKRLDEIGKQLNTIERNSASLSRAWRYLYGFISGWSRLCRKQSRQPRMRSVPNDIKLL